MNLKILDIIFLRGCLPVFLFSSVISRYNGLSFIYLVMLLFCPFLKFNVRAGMTKCVTVYLAVLSALSGVFCLAIIVWNVLLLYHSGVSGNCNVTESAWSHSLNSTSGSFRQLQISLTHQIGLTKLQGLPISRIFRLVFPDYLIFGLSVGLLLYLRRRRVQSQHSGNLNEKVDNLKRKSPDLTNIPQISENGIPLQNSPKLCFRHNYLQKTLGIEMKKKKWRTWAMRNMFVFLHVVLIGLAGIASPSVLNSIYLIFFLGICTFWASGRKIVPEKFANLRKILVVYSALHVCLIYTVQIEFAQYYLPNGHFLSRLLGIYYIIDSSCRRNGEFLIKPQRWIDYFSPTVVMAVFYFSATEVRRWRLKDQTPDFEKLISSEQPFGEPRLRNKKSLNDMELMPENRQSIRNNSCQSCISEANELEELNLQPLIREPMVFDDTTNKKRQERPLLLSIIDAIIRNSYVVTFITMMAWSATYKSWMSFILLLFACYLWMAPNSRHICLTFSPVIVFYGTVLIIIQYIYGFNLPELPVETITSNGYKIDFSEIGLQKWDIPTGPLAIMISFLVIFWLTLRLFTTDRILHSEEFTPQSANDQSQDTNTFFGDVDNRIFKKMISVLNGACERYWILVCCFAMLFVAINGPVVLYRIVYMVLLVYFLTMFMLSYSFWRKQMIVFWWLVIVYSVLVLLTIYTFQFKQVPYLWQNYTGISKEFLDDLGLRSYKSSKLFQGLLTPVIFLVILILQLRYFHKPFLKLSSLNRIPSTRSSKNQDHSTIQNNINKYDSQSQLSNESKFIDDLSSMFQKIIRKLKMFMRIIDTNLWRFVECHSTKAVALMIMYICIREVNALNIVPVVIVIIGFPIPKLHYSFVTGSFLYSSMVVLFKMVYQLKTVHKLNWFTNCSVNNYPMNDHRNVSFESISSTKWIGLERNEMFHTYIWNWGAVLVVCTLWHAVKYHQMQFYLHPRVKTPLKGIIFPEVTLDSPKDSLINLFKALNNFFFYHLGLEVCFVITIVVSCLRVDVYSIIYLVLLFVFLFTKRRIYSKLWLPYMIFLGCLIPVQYSICVGIPPSLCQRFPLSDWKHALKQWLYLPNFNNPPASEKIMADFFQFALVALQYEVFKLKDSNLYENRDEPHGMLPEIINKDFMTTKHSYVDYLKHAIYYWWYWITLSVIFTTGVYWITLFCLGYMIISFIYLWIGHDLLTQNVKHIISSWNIVILYNFLVILSKCGLQLVGCVYIAEMIGKGLCWMIPLLGIQCINPLSWNIVNVTVNPVNEYCSSVPNGLHWDVVCFFFVIFQRRIFQTDLFRFVTLDFNILNKFASRGAFLINMKIMDNIQEQRLKEKNEISRIERKIEKIKKLQAQHGKPILNDHYLVIRSGDYYLFDGDPEKEDQEEDDNEDNNEDIFEFISALPIVTGKNDHGELSKSGSRRSSVHSRKACKIFGDSQHHLLKTIHENKIVFDSEGNIMSCFDSDSFVHSGTDDDQSEDDSSEDSCEYSLQSQKIMNPLKLISKALEHGPRAAVKRYRQSISESRDHLSDTRRSTSSYQTEITKSGVISVSNPNIFQSNPNVDKGKSDIENVLWANNVSPCDVETPRDFNSFQCSPIPSENEGCSEYSRQEVDNISEYVEQGKETQCNFSESSSSGNCWNKFKFNVLLVLVLFDSAASFLIRWLDSLNADYYNTSKKLDNEKRIVKKIILNKLSENIDNELNLPDELLFAGRNSFEKSENRNEILKQKEFQNSRSKFFSLIIAICNVVNIHSEVICYVILISNHIVSGNVISLPYPLMVFLWAMLSVPRPSKTFWITLITYTEIVIVIKYIFQFKIITFNILPTTHRIDPLWYPLIIGIEKSKNYALFDVIQLLFVFLHRDYLRRNGLWRDHTEFCKDVYIEDELDEENPRQSCGSRFRKLFHLIGQMKHFYSKMTNPKLNKKVDVYTFMFLFEFLSFWTIILGYFSFGPGTDSGDNAIIFIKTNKIPAPFIAMLITQFLFFIIDRGLFLRKNVKGKFVFQIFHVLLIHAWLFFVLPYATKKKFDSHIAPKVLYVFKCVYFALSAYQMKSGYPLRILGNFLTKKYNYPNLIFFKGYRAIPFLYELRNVMDWMWTDTSVAFYHWMEVEDIFSKIFVLKCWRRAEIFYPTDRGQKRKLSVRYTIGGLLLLFLAICFWGPLAISSFIGTTFIKNRPIECSFSINVGGYSPFFVFNCRENNLKHLSAETFRKMKECYHAYSTSLDYLQSFEVGDVTEMLIDGPSDDAWLITPPGLEKLKEKLGSWNESLKINIQVICERQMTEVKFTQKIVHYTHSRKLTVNEKNALLRAMDNDNNNNNESFVYLNDVFPRFLTAYKRKLSKADPLHRDRNNTLLNLGLITKLSSSMMWWEINENVFGKTFCSENITKPVKKPFITVYIFNERISDSFFGTIFSNYGIIGIYAAYFFVVHRVLRSFYSNISYIVPFEELPNVDQILKLLNDIYLVRENKMFSLEEELIAKLIFLYRSSKTMIDWTRQKASILEAHAIMPNLNDNGNVHSHASTSSLNSHES